MLKSINIMIRPNKKIQEVTKKVINKNKFLWKEEEGILSLEDRLAKQYYDKLFKEYCIGDFKHYKINRVALRWRTRAEVICGKGQIICGNKKCNSAKVLKSWEVNFNYIEHNQSSNALVKLRLCSRCSIKLNYFKNTKMKKENQTKFNKFNSNYYIKTISNQTDFNTLWMDNQYTEFDQNIYDKIETYLKNLF